MVNKKAQMKIQQMAFMLIAVTLLFALVGIFVLGFSLSGLKEKATSLEQENAMLLASRIANSPEFSCSSDFESPADCIDMDKVMVLKQETEKYSGFWGIENLEIRKIYPENERICTLQNYPDCGRIVLREDSTQGFYVSNFAILCGKSSSSEIPYDKCELGKIMISYIEK